MEINTEHLPKDSLEPDSVEDITLMKAVEHGDLKEVKIAIEEGASIKRKHMHNAMMTKKLDIIEYLLEQDYPGTTEELEIILGLGIIEGKKQLVSKLIKKGVKKICSARFDGGENLTAFETAVTFRRTSITKMIVKATQEEWTDEEDST